MLLYNSIGISLFKLIYKYKPQISFNWDRPIGPITARKHLSYKKAQIFTKRIITEPCSRNYGGSYYWAGYIGKNRATI